MVFYGGLEKKRVFRSQKIRLRRLLLATTQIAKKHRRREKIVFRATFQRFSGSLIWQKMSDSQKYRPETPEERGKQRKKREKKKKEKKEKERKK